MQKYIRSSFFAGRGFASMTDMVAQARRWSAEVAGRRTPRVLEGRTPLEVFASEEAGALQPLPMVPFEHARWSTPKVAPDSHAKVGATLYSLPYKWIGVRLDARATVERVQFFYNGGLVKTHPFQAKGRRTDWADLPEQKVGFFMRNPAWCRLQASMIGPAVDAVIGELLAINAIFRLRQAQGVLRLAGRYGDERLEAACQRAIEAGDPSYRTVKGVLAAGTENAPVQQRLAGIDTPAWLRGPTAFGTKDATR